MSAVSRISFVIKDPNKHRVPVTPLSPTVFSLSSKKDGRNGEFLGTRPCSLVYPAGIPDMLVREIFPKTARFPAFEMPVYLDRQYGKLPESQIRQAQYRQLSFLPPFNAERDDLMLRYQTIWYMLAELIRSAIIVPESNQLLEFLLFILTLIKEELAYMQTSPNVICSVSSCFLGEEILKPIAAAELRERCPDVDRFNMLMNELLSFKAKYLKQGENCMPLIPRNPPVLIQTAGEAQQPSRQSLAELGIYGMKPSAVLRSSQAQRSLI